MTPSRCRTGVRCRECARAGARDRRSPTMRVIVCAVGLALVTSPAFAQESSAAGRIKIATGSVFIVRADETVAARAGELVYEADTLRTGDDGRLGITLKDDTRLSLGPDSEVRLDRFAFAPAEGRMAFVLKVVKGVAAYVSGQIANIAPDAVRLETPSAIVGIRGTTVVIRAPQK